MTFPAPLIVQVPHKFQRSYCKKIRNDQNYRQRVEDYISDHTDVEFSHGVCPDCHSRVAGEIEELQKSRQADFIELGV